MISIVITTSYDYLSNFGMMVVYIISKFDYEKKLKLTNKEGGHYDFSKVEPKKKPV